MLQWHQFQFGRNSAESFVYLHCFNLQKVDHSIWLIVHIFEVFGNHIPGDFQIAYLCILGKISYFFHCLLYIERLVPCIDELAHGNTVEIDYFVLFDLLLLFLLKITQIYGGHMQVLFGRAF
jgi:hypothetical protein